MHDHLDQLASRRIGRPDDVTQIEADIEVGWAYRLLQLFGTMRELTFDPGCAGRAQLVRAGILDVRIENIAETFRSEQRRSRRGVFEKQVTTHMVEVGLPDTALNRERGFLL